MRRLVMLSIALGVAAVAAVLVARAPAASTGSSFRTPDAGAACRLEGQALVCSSLGSSGSVALPPSGAASVVGELPWWDASTPVLRRWSRGDLQCRLSGDAILCRNASTAISDDTDGFAVAG
jgi:hypothetical protein